MAELDEKFKRHFERYKYLASEDSDLLELEAQLEEDRKKDDFIPFLKYFLNSSEISSYFRYFVVWNAHSLMTDDELAEIAKDLIPQNIPYLSEELQYLLDVRKE